MRIFKNLCWDLLIINSLNVRYSFWEFRKYFIFFHMKRPLFICPWWVSLGALFGISCNLWGISLIYHFVPTKRIFFPCFFYVCSVNFLEISLIYHFNSSQKSIFKNLCLVLCHYKFGESLVFLLGISENISFLSTWKDLCLFPVMSFTRRTFRNLL